MQGLISSPVGSLPGEPEISDRHLVTFIVFNIRHCVFQYKLSLAIKVDKNWKLKLSCLHIFSDCRNLQWKVLNQIWWDPAVVSSTQCGNWESWTGAGNRAEGQTCDRPGLRPLQVRSEYSQKYSVKLSLLLFLFQSERREKLKLSPRATNSWIICDVFFLRIRLLFTASNSLYCRQLLETVIEKSNWSSTIRLGNLCNSDCKFIYVLDK